MRNWLASVRNYIEFTKPRETILLGFTGLAAAIIAAKGRPELLTLLLVTLAVTVGSAGSNGVTNYLDRNVDSRMERTRHRPLPSGRIYPPERSLVWSIFLLITGLTIAWFLDPRCFYIGAAGSMLAVIARKSSITHILGIGSSCSPALIGWIAVRHSVNSVILIISLMIALWVPIHVWSVMVSYREDYLKAGVTMFPLTIKMRIVAWILFLLTVLLYVCSLALYFTGYFSLFYLLAANVLGVLALAASVMFVAHSTEASAFRVYKISAFPYLGVLLLTMIIDQLFLAYF